MPQGEKSADKAIKKAAESKSTGTYKVTVTGTIQKNGNPDPTPIGDYKVTDLSPTSG